MSRRAGKLAAPPIARLMVRRPLRVLLLTIALPARLASPAPPATPPPLPPSQPPSSPACPCLLQAWADSDTPPAACRAAVEDACLFRTYAYDGAFCPLRDFLASSDFQGWLSDAACDLAPRFFRRDAFSAAFPGSYRAVLVSSMSPEAFALSTFFDAARYQLPPGVHNNFWAANTSGAQFLSLSRAGLRGLGLDPAAVASTSSWRHEEAVACACLTDGWTGFGFDFTQYVQSPRPIPPSMDLSMLGRTFGQDWFFLPSPRCGSQLDVRCFLGSCSVAIL